MDCKRFTLSESRNPLRFLKLPQNIVPRAFDLSVICCRATIIPSKMQGPLTQAFLHGSIHFLATLDADIEGPEEFGWRRRLF